MTRSGGSAAAVLAAALAAAARPAAADPAPRTAAPGAAPGTVLAVDGAEVTVDLGASHGVGAGATLDLLHRITARDPVSGQKLEDRFSIGQLTVVRAGDRVAVARAPEALEKRVKVGDGVVLVSAPVAYADPWQLRVEASRSGGGAVARPAGAGAGGRSGTGAGAGSARDAARRAAHAERTRTVWQATLGKPPAERVALWRRLLEAEPGLIFAAEVREEIASLEEQAAALERAAARRSAGPPLERMLGSVQGLTAGARRAGPLVGAPITRAAEGQRVDLAFAVADRAAAAEAWLYVRAPGEGQFERIPLEPDGDAYLRATVPAALVRPPRLEYFVEVGAAGGEPEPVLGSSEAPLPIEVEASAAEAPPERSGRSQVTLLAEYVDFDGSLAGGFDQYYQVEADFLYRFLRPIYGFRLGFGTLSGTGGPKDVIDEDPADACRDADGIYQCRELTYSYIYAELEHRFSDTIAVMVRPQAGRLTADLRAGSSSDRCLGADLDDCELERGLGLRLRVRLGEELGTNLALGVGVTAGVGTLLEAAYASTAAPRLPIRLAVQVTDQPVQGDFGVRLVGDVGYRALPWIYPSVRLSYQARDVDHAGFSGGAGINFDW